MQALGNIKAHLLRSSLTLFGILMGTAAVVTLLTGGELATRAALDQFKKLGMELMGVSLIKSENNLRLNHVELTQMKHLKTLDISDFIPYTVNYSSVFFKNKKIDLAIFGADSLQKFIELPLLSGRSISILDRNSLYCVLGYEVWTQLSHDPNDLIGEQISINNVIFTIIGVLDHSKKNLFLMADCDQAIVIPLQTSLDIFQNIGINQFIFKIKPQTNIKKLENDMVNKFRIIFPGYDVNFKTPESIMENMKGEEQILRWLLGLIASITLLVGGVGVMNIMLVSVTERRQEIGIRMCIGARERDIVYLFLTEATILTVLGGIAGIVLGELIVFAASAFFKWPFHFIWFPILMGFSVSFLVGIFFGYYPAKRASKLNPILILNY